MLARYERLVEAGELRSDADQRRAAERLDKLQRELASESSGGLLSQLFGGRKTRPQGVYMWGGVGRGKSMLMDLFVETLEIGQKRRVHFHEFMLEVDRRMRERRETDPGDPTGKVARDIATQRLHNSGFNCVATQIVVIPQAWSKADAFVDRLRHHLAIAPTRPAYYPGASSRQLAVVTVHPHANVLGGDSNVPRTLVDHLDPQDADEHLFTQEAFGPVLGVVRLPGTREPEPYLAAAVAFANEKLAGTLSASIHLHPSTREALGGAFDDLVAQLRYGTIGINAWGGTVFGMPGGTWGAFPGHTLAEVGSGLGIVHNALLLDPDHVERTVAEGPWRAPSSPPETPMPM
jgi:hypothetical protein